MIDVETLRPTADEMLSGLKTDGVMQARILFKAQAVEKLPQIAGEMLGGLRATSALRHRILVAADRKRAALTPVFRPSARPAFSRLTPAMGMALVLALMIGLGILHGGSPLVAGVPGGETVLGAGSLGAQGVAPTYTPLWAGQGANPPIIGINGRYYRMLNTPFAASSSLVDSVIYEVQEFTEEPSLKKPVGAVSNIAQVGAKIYSIKGLSSKTACLAEVDGALRVFQRVGYASETLVGTEMFEDTFGVYGQVEMLELSGAGVIKDKSRANELIYCISEFAVQGDGTPEGSQALTVYLENGLSLQLMVQDETLIGCGAWTCPEFFAEFQDALLQE